MNNFISINQGFQIIGTLFAIIILLMIIAFKKDQDVKNTRK